MEGWKNGAAKICANPIYDRNNDSKNNSELVLGNEASFLPLSLLSIVYYL